jgi:hypothetical protein
VRLVETQGYTAAWMQPTSVSVPNLRTLNYYYCPSGGTSCTTNNGNVLSQGIAHGTHGSWTDSYSYDAFNRLTLASETGPPLTLATPTSPSALDTPAWPTSIL